MPIEPPIPLSEALVETINELLPPLKQLVELAEQDASLSRLRDVALQLERETLTYMPASQD